MCGFYNIHVFDESWEAVRAYPLYGAFACDTDDDMNLYVTAGRDYVVCLSSSPLALS